MINIVDFQLYKITNVMENSAIQNLFKPINN